ncbi:allophanate hydrolase [Paraburkholderia tropica]|uniref:Allophanate hydrolase n=2 Tax=Paraburkholderia tropica TaxID=92647 RepID=A0AAQ1JSV8_9BURK|nr:allophanate hydrolase [Paraburkholderia tropica]RQN39727.1 allophanate hydrolase [Paraburkholderia tropica]SEJ23361.1 allophanate hydrolase [Paraburkholderia tropica]
MPMNLLSTTPDAAGQPMTIAALRARYLDGSLTPAQLVDRIAAHTAGDDPHRIWIRALTRDEMMRYADALASRDPATLPLYGIPFAIKDNIDLAGVPTTAGCPDYAYLPEKSAPVVERLIAAGAIPVGKTNLDQFATGLSGQRSPYGACRNALDPEYASGGSSSGSAVSVAMGLAAFSLGTDTAGSGRVPAAFHGLVGLKPTKGVLSTLGVVPACRSLDCVSIFAHTADDAQRVFASAHGVAQNDPYARAWQGDPGAHAAFKGLRLGVPRASQREFYGDASYAQAFDAALDALRAAGAQLVEIDFEPFLATARLLYEGPFVAERLAAIRPFYEAHPDALHPVTRAIIGGAARWSAADAFAAQDTLAALRMQAERVWPEIDAIVTPTSPTTSTVAELEADPIGVNARFGYYTNFVNLLDLSALAVPAGRCESGAHAGKPFGITFVGRAHEDAKLLDIARTWLGEAASNATVTSAAPATVRVAVVGAHLSGEPLNAQLTSRAAKLVAATTTSKHYRLYALPKAASQGIEKPGLVRVAQDGHAIEVEVWEMPVEHYGSFVALIPSPLGIGMLELANGGFVQGFLCERLALDGAEDISAFGGWRAYRRSAAQLA